MMIFLHGEDSFLLNRRRAALVSIFRQKYPEAPVHIFDFEDQGSADDVQRALSACSQGLFSVRSMVVMIHPLSLSDAPAAILFESVEAGLGKSPDIVLMFVQPGKLKKGDSLSAKLLELSDKEEIFSKVDAKDTSTLMRFIKKELASIMPAMSFSDEALRMFAARTGADTSRIVSELEKLIAYKEGSGQIGPDDVAVLLEVSEESALFEALDSLGRGNRHQAYVLLSAEAARSDAYPVLAMCAWQVRRMMAVRDAFDKGIRRSSDIVATAKLAPFAVEKILRTIENFPMERLRSCLGLLAEFDIKLKTGAMDPDVALSLFVWKF